MGRNTRLGLERLSTSVHYVTMAPVQPYGHSGDTISNKVGPWSEPDAMLDVRLTPIDDMCEGTRRLMHVKRAPSVARTCIALAVLSY